MGNKVVGMSTVQHAAPLGDPPTALIWMDGGCGHTTLCLGGLGFGLNGELCEGPRWAPVHTCVPCASLLATCGTGSTAPTYLPACLPAFVLTFTTRRSPWARRSAVVLRSPSCPRWTKDAD